MVSLTKSSMRVRDMTEGKPLQLIISFAIPLFIGNIFQQFYSMVDTMVAEYHLGDPTIAAIGATASLYSLLINFANGLNNGYGIVITQRFGARDSQKMKQAIAAHAASRKLLMMIQPQVSICVANSTFVGQNWGAKLFDRIRTTLRKVLLLEIGWSVASMVIIYLFGASLVRFTTGTNDPEMVKNAVLSLRIHFSTFPFLGILFVMRYSLQAMGYKLIPVCSSVIELCMKILSSGWLIPRIGFLGTCVTEPVTWVIMAVFLVTFYLAKRGEMAARMK